MTNSKWIAVDSNHTIVIQADATAEQLVADAEEAFKQAGYPYMGDLLCDDVVSFVRRELELVKGKTLQVLTYEFGDRWSIADGREFQKAQGFEGNAAALFVWATRWKKLDWWLVSFSNKDNRLFRCDESSRALTFFQDEEICAFDLAEVDVDWPGDHLLVAFRAI